MGNNLPYVNLGTGRTAQSVSVGDISACAILDNHELKCWGKAIGYGDSLFRGHYPGSMGDNLPSIDLGSGRTAISVEVGYDSYCALLDNQRLKCWGVADRGQTGYGDTISRGESENQMGDNLPYVDFGDEGGVPCKSCTSVKAVKLAAKPDWSTSMRNGKDSACVILGNDLLKCWGDAPGYGDLISRGDGTSEMGNNLPFLYLG